MNSTPKVSVIIPVYNVEEYVGCCVRSVFMQDWKNIEFIFVDDASTDRSVSIIEEILNLEFPELRPCVKISTLACVVSTFSFVEFTFVTSAAIAGAFVLSTTATSFWTS